MSPTPVPVVEALRVFGLVNNADAARQNSLLTLEENDLKLSFPTGFEATDDVGKAAHDELAKTRGFVANFGSAAATNS